MEYLYEEYFFDENIEPTSQIFDEEKNHENRIDSDMEAAVYSPIHKSKNPSYKYNQEETFINEKINSENNIIPKKHSKTNLDNNIKVISENISSENISTSSDSNTQTRNEERKWWENFISISHNNENINFSEHHLQTLSNSDNIELNKINSFNKKKKFFSNEDSSKNDSSKFSLKQITESDDDEDIWHVNYEDITQNQNLRYYNKYRNLMCYNCLKMGHREEDCDQPKKQRPCLLCGIYGHKAKNCSQAVCNICQTTDHKTKRCKNSQIHCNICQYDGHTSENCPDIWRRYHLTRNEDQVACGLGNVNTKVYCYNCGNSGHFGHQCTDPRDDCSLATSPFIVSYDFF